MIQGKVIDFYVDGSYIASNATWAFVGVQDEKEIIRRFGKLSGKINQMRQIGGELRAVEEAIRFCRETGVKARIFYDYTGIYHWICDLYGRRKAWNAKNEFTKAYRDYIETHRDYVVEWVKVKAHQIGGNPWNALADSLAGSVK